MWARVRLAGNLQPARGHGRASGRLLLFPGGAMLYRRLKSRTQALSRTGAPINALVFWFHPYDGG